MALAGKPAVRDVVNHVLFEISTEVAHRGKLARLICPGSSLTWSKLVVFILSLNRRLDTQLLSTVFDILCWEHGIKLRYVQFIPAGLLQKELNDYSL